MYSQVNLITEGLRPSEEVTNSVKVLEGCKSIVSPTVVPGLQV